ncbi:heparinase II/III-family protein [Marinilongibacter aquaticus]|uniref:heparinase II/III-family protein n=1 Tax=Marinilongibacter aquaticus TaxID=2975157 RepID=UPI0021BD0320|nr:heparinase II/III-family protein [Marinilongibacter aquaticus]UBM57262.1 heparinase II/III-family protein [Marinilongibacter aquaticus]
MKIRIVQTINLFFLFALLIGARAQTLQNPIDAAYLKTHLKKDGPRMVLTNERLMGLKEKIKTDPLVKNYYLAMKLNAEAILKQPELERIMTGRRLLSVSREMLYRMNVLCMLYKIDGDKALLNKIKAELEAVCAFKDWNPSHYLDVAEMSLALALAIDWTGDDLPKTTVSLVQKNLIEKGIMPSFEKKQWWVDGNNNWNQVCNAGMIAAAIATYDKDAELAAKTIARSLDGMPHALKEYGPDGVYPEGATYWSYGTGFSVVTSSLLETAFGTDFGVYDFPAFKESALFKVLSEAPSGWYYNFADCGDKPGKNGDIILAWFAMKSGNSMYLKKDDFLAEPSHLGKLDRNCGSGLVWLSMINLEQEAGGLPTAWMGKGDNPVVFFREETEKYFLGAKGGRGSVNHGNMDAGSFVFELDGTRWVVDPGNQNYNDLEKTGFDLWGKCQNCERWTLLTKNNFGHSTISINDSLHRVNGYADIVEFEDGMKPQAKIDMTAVFGDFVTEANREFTKDSPRSLLIKDHLKLNGDSKSIVWQLMTTADVELVKGGLLLRKDGQELLVENLSHPALHFSVIELDPAPLELDRQIKGLKRVELRVPAWTVGGDELEIKVRLNGN